MGPKCVARDKCVVLRRSRFRVPVFQRHESFARVSIASAVGQQVARDALEIGRRIGEFRQSPHAGEAGESILHEVRCRMAVAGLALEIAEQPRSEEHTSELQSLMRISYAVFCLKKKKTNRITTE